MRSKRATIAHANSELRKTSLLDGIAGTIHSMSFETGTRPTYRFERVESRSNKEYINYRSRELVEKKKKERVRKNKRANDVSRVVPTNRTDGELSAPDARDQQQ